jgi:hypothetical protein
MTAAVLATSTGGGHRFRKTVTLCCTAKMIIEHTRSKWRRTSGRTMRGRRG